MRLPFLCAPSVSRRRQCLAIGCMSILVGLWQSSSVEAQTINWNSPISPVGISASGAPATLTIAGSGFNCSS